jgi:methylmalonyl-CoA mutase C-terminal domain/subunit
MKRRARILVAKPGLDGHDRGAKVIALALRDAGFEVIYSGLHRSIPQIVETGTQEDVDVIGLSILSGAHVPLATSLMDQLKSEGFQPIVILGGNIPERDIEALKSLGVAGVFPTGSRFEEIIEFIEGALGSKAVS